jgi:hypothetical protein
MKPRMFKPSRLRINRQRPVLNTSDVLWDSAQFPGNLEPILKERSGDRGSKEHAEVWHESAQRIEHRHHLRGVAEPVR